ncbi:MAG: imidazoleglycerol-phosphate dehydratase [Thermoplasmatota archaeon]
MTDAPTRIAGGKASLERKTKETTITVELDLQGSGSYDVATDNKFLTHMVETLTRYAGFDLKLRATGDLDHHLIEDVAITMGQAFREAFAGAPCARMAFDQVCMDDVLMACTVDVVDRPYYEGPLPIPIYDHWFRSFAMEARINLHLEHKRGRDTHHAVEAAFKSFGRALRQALAARVEEVSTKGVVQTGGEGSS